MLGISVAVMASITSVSWKTTSIHLGEVQKNEVNELAFEFMNHSSEPIQIVEAKGSCGCTSVNYPKEAIQPGESAAITANFKSGKVGAFKKSIRITTSDSDEPTFLYFNGEVVE